MGIVAAASNLDYNGWLRGLFGAGISSAGGAISAGFGPAIVDPNDFNMAHPAMMIKTALIGGAVAAIISMSKFLQAQPLPSIKESIVRQVVTPATATTPQTTKTIEDVHTETITPTPKPPMP